MINHAAVSVRLSGRHMPYLMLLRTTNRRRTDSKANCPRRSVVMSSTSFDLICVNGIPHTVSTVEVKGCHCLVYRPPEHTLRDTFIGTVASLDLPETPGTTRKNNILLRSRSRSPYQQRNFGSSYSKQLAVTACPPRRFCPRILTPSTASTSTISTTSTYQYQRPKWHPTPLPHPTPTIQTRPV